MISKWWSSACFDEERPPETHSRKNLARWPRTHHYLDCANRILNDISSSHHRVVFSYREQRMIKVTSSLILKASKLNGQKSLAALKYYWTVGSWDEALMFCKAMECSPLSFVRGDQCYTLPVDVETQGWNTSSSQAFQRGTQRASTIMTECSNTAKNCFFPSLQGYHILVLFHILQGRLKQAANKCNLQVRGLSTQLVWCAHARKMCELSSHVNGSLASGNIYSEWTKYLLSFIPYHCHIRYKWCGVLL